MILTNTKISKGIAMRITILLDYRSQFYSSTRSRGAALNTDLLCREFTAKGYQVEVKHFVEINFRREDYKGVVILYQSSEDPSLKYKDYIEDVLLGLCFQGAVLVPDFMKFRAHHNKVFMEILRDVQGGQVCESIQSETYGTFEEFLRFHASKIFPVVMKSAEGSKSIGTMLIRNWEKGVRVARKLSITPSLANARLILRHLWDRRGYVPLSNHRRKFVVQNFIGGFSGDYKVLVYDKKYFVLFRKNRPNDFRASGSGRITFPDQVPQRVLNCAEQVFAQFNVPFASLDIGDDGERCHVLEFQFVTFGQYAVERSTHFFSKIEGKWERLQGSTTAENEIVVAVDSYLKRISQGGH